MELKDKIKKFEDDHPLWFFVIVRLLICAMWAVVAACGVAAFICAFRPFVEWLTGGGFFPYCLLWIACPVLVATSWSVSGLALVIYDELA